MYNKILQRLKENNYNVSNIHILIPIQDNIFELDGIAHFGRLFEKENIVYLVYDIDDSWDGHKELVLYRISNKFSTYLSNGYISSLVEFYIVE